MRLRPRHLRTRLTLWYVAVLAALLVLAWGGTCALLFWQLRSQLDHFAIQEIETVEGLFYLHAGRTAATARGLSQPSGIEGRDRALPGSALARWRGAVSQRAAREPRAGRQCRFAGEGVGGYSERSARLSDGTRVRLVSRVHSSTGVLC